jgi:hypothetical protein
MFFASKGNATVNDAWWLYVQPAGTPRFGIWNGGAITFKSHSTAYDLSAWNFIAGQFVPSTSVDIWLNESKESNVAAVPATITNSAFGFAIGASAAPSNYFTGRSSIFGVYASVQDDDTVSALYQNTRAAFGR